MLALIWRALTAMLLHEPSSRLPALVHQPQQVAAAQHGGQHTHGQLLRRQQAQRAKMSAANSNTAAHQAGQHHAGTGGSLAPCCAPNAAPPDPTKAINPVCATAVPVASASASTRPPRIGTQGQAQAGGRGFAQHQPVQHARQRPGRGGEHSSQAAGHHSAGRPAHKGGAAHGQRPAWAAESRASASWISRAQRPAPPPPPPRQQQAQRVLHALRQNQRQKHRPAAPTKAMPVTPSRGSQLAVLGAHRRTARPAPRPAPRPKHCPAGTDRPTGCETSPWAMAPSQAQQRPGQPCPQRARQANLPHDLLRQQVAAQVQQAAEARAADAGAEQQQRHAGGQQPRGPASARAAAGVGVQGGGIGCGHGGGRHHGRGLREARAHSYFSARQRAMMPRGLGHAPAGRTTTSDSRGRARTRGPP